MTQKVAFLDSSEMIIFKHILHNHSLFDDTNDYRNVRKTCQKHSKMVDFGHFQKMSPRQEFWSFLRLQGTNLAYVP